MNHIKQECLSQQAAGVSEPAGAVPAVSSQAEPLQERLAALHQSALELVQESTLESLLRRLALLALNRINAAFAAVGVLDKSCDFVRFIPVGEQEEIDFFMECFTKNNRMIGLFNHNQNALRLQDIQPCLQNMDLPEPAFEVRSFLGVPIWYGEQQVGQILLINRKEIVDFSADDQKVIETLASYAAISITNAQLYQQLLERERALTRRNETMAALNQLASTLAASNGVEEILDKALADALALMGIEIGELHLKQEDGLTFRLVRHQGTSVTDLFLRKQFLLREGIVGRVADSGQLLTHVLPDDSLTDLSPDIQSGEFSQISTFPLTGQGGVLGTLSIVIREPRPLDEIELQFMTAISAWMGTAVENLNLNTQQRRLAVLEERERIAMDLHDGIIQSIYAVGLTLEHARMLLNDDIPQARSRISQAIADLDKTIRDIRSYILDLRPRTIQEESLNANLARLVAEFKANTFVDTALQLPAEDIPQLSSNGAATLFHICQEALANVAKHARASHVDVVLWSTSDRALLEIGDNGRGFDMKVLKLTLGHGLMNIQTRAHTVAGDVEFSTEPGQGTTILAWVPLGESPVKHSKAQLV